jgi:hypothetical protein
MLIIPACLIACSPEPATESSPTESVPPSQPAPVEQPPSLTGKELVDIHCVRCHIAPGPEDLPKEVWPETLAGMGYYLGFNKGDELPDFTIAPPDPENVEEPDPSDYRYYGRLLDREGVEHRIWGYEEFVLPEPVITEAEWIAMRDYLVDNAASMADMYIHRPKQPVLEGFTPTTPPLDIEPNGLVFTTLVDADRNRMYIGRSVMDDWKAGGRPGVQEGTDDLLAFDLTTGERTGYETLPTDPIGLEVTETGIRLSTHGEFPLELGNAQGYIMDWDGFGEENSQKRMLVNGVHRITQHKTRDLDGDGLDDILLNTFGDGILVNYGGLLSIFWQSPEYAELWKDAPAEIPHGPLEGALEETVLSNHTGMISSAIGDFNGDGRPDIVVLTAQGLQQISVFINQGDRSFEQQVIKQYSPSWGFNMVYAADMDGDGHTDIVVVNGDNVAANNVGSPFAMAKPKPYHGLRIYRNDGESTFEEAYFYPMHGAIRAVVEDFDADGDQDVAMISMWPDWSFEEPETFVYLENEGGLEFSPQSLPTENFGIWVSIETFDVNADEKPDIVLGLANWPTLVPEDWLTRPVMEGRNGEAPSITFLVNDH